MRRRVRRGMDREVMEAVLPGFSTRAVLREHRSSRDLGMAIGYDATLTVSYTVSAAATYLAFAGQLFPGL